MAKQKKKYKPTIASAVPPPQQEIKLERNSRLNIIIPIVIAVVTFICFHRALQNQFLNWDDGIYVTNDPYITKMTGTNIKKLLFENVTQNYYHPLTMLTLAANYHFSQLKPEAYYVTNIVIHIINAILVFFLATLLFETMVEKIRHPRIRGIPWLAGLCALWFAIHPMHVESVAWLSERKDVMYGFFYFLGLIMYVKYFREGEKRKWMIYVALCYIASLLSKPMAVSFPLSLFAIDILLRRENIRKLIIEKWPFFVLSLAGGALAFLTTANTGQIAFLHGYTIIQKFCIACYGFMMYTSKAFVPVNLCSFYPYPNLFTDYTLPSVFYFAPLAAAAIASIPIYLTYRFARNYFNVVLFGMGFYFANLVFVLQFVSAGMTVMMERYTYIAYFGLFFLLAWCIYRLWEKLPAFRMLLYVLVGGVTAFWGYLCMERTKVWHDSGTLWSDVVAKYPDQIEKAYENLADFYAENGEYDKAYPSYVELVKMKSTAPSIYRNLGNIYAMRKEYDQSLAMYNQSLKLDSLNYDTYLDLGVTYSIMGKLDLALVNYNKAYRIDTASEKLLQNRAYTYFSGGQYALAITDYNHLIRMNPTPEYYFYRGQAEHNKGDYGAAIADYLHSLAMKPGNPDCMYDLSMAYKSIKDYSNALNYAEKAGQAGFKLPDNYIAQLQQLAKSAH